ncbi:hypothetical protein A3K93_13435 (plasmid) [Acinetobacter sp. NCu2D-2]|uniref:ABC transporter ATP-binding protein n=1 Tax=Acinetobacter sp. NCu2D-2 TaxID=1608473 RepID=UPI0007CDFD47|nr:ABC transporter ATP-binding protein [Acinetobacter sp. NCu2D-2]ANF83243.1 hypothetical protein A3K93_13435 [Acinetobacter sp. NCu2D-2]
MSSVSIKHLNKAFDGRVNAIKDLSLQIKDGEFFVLLGPSGCGKTTTLRCIAGLEDPDAGEIRIADDLVLAPQQGIFVPPEKREMGMVFQSYALWPHMTVWDNVAYPIKTRRKIAEKEKQQIFKTLQLVGLEDFIQRYPSELSGGQQQRVALARALVNEPRVLLFDEPLSNLDASLRIKLRMQLRHLQKEVGYTAIYVTHDHSEALALADRIAIMRSGYLEQIGTPSEIFLKPKSKYVAEFVGFENILEAKIIAKAEKTIVHLAQHATDIEVDNIPNLPFNQSVYVALRSSQIIGKPLRLDVHDPAYDYLIGELQAVSYAGDYYLAEVKLVQHDQKGGINTLDTVLQVHLPLSYWGSDIQYVSSFIHQHLELSIQKGAMVILDDVVNTAVQTEATAQVA